MTCLHQFLRHRTWIALLAIAAALIVTPSFAPAQAFCASGELSNGYIGDSQTDIEQTVCIGSDWSYAEVENDSYGTYQDYDTLFVYGVGEEAVISNGGTLYDSGMTLGQPDSNGGSSVYIDVPGEIYVPGAGGGDMLNTSIIECQGVPDSDSIPLCYWDYIDPMQGLSVQYYAPPLPTPTVSLISSPTSSSYGQSVTLIANISVNIDGEAIEFVEGNSTLIGNVAVSGNTATFTTSILLPGTHSISAYYYGDNNYSPALSNSVTQVVNSSASPGPTLSLNTSGTPSLLDQQVTITATITGGVTGMVTFYDGFTLIGRAPINGATATIATMLTAGNHSISATWEGNSSYSTVASAAIAQTVQSCCAIPDTETTVAMVPGSFGSLYAYTEYFQQTLSSAAGDSFFDRSVTEQTGQTGFDSCYWNLPSTQHGSFTPMQGVDGFTWIVGRAYLYQGAINGPQQWGADDVGYHNDAVKYYRAYNATHGISSCGFTLYQNMEISCSAGGPMTYSLNTLTATIYPASVVDCRQEAGQNSVCATIGR